MSESGKCQNSERFLPSPNHPAPSPPTRNADLPGEPDSDRFSVQWSRTQLPVRAFLIGYLSDRTVVDDCVQEVAILGWKKGPVMETPEQFLAFCLACAKRIAMAEVRKKYRKRHQLLSVESLELLADRVATLEHQDASEPPARISALQECLGSLGPDARQLLELRYSNSSGRDALKKQARSTGMSMDAIYKKLERLRTALRDCVTKRINKGVK